MEPMKPMKPMEPMDFGTPWWPAHLGSPATSGAQDGARYAYFPQTRRLIVERDGAARIYDTADHQIGGVSQANGSARSLTFTSQDGPVNIDDLSIVEA